MVWMLANAVIAIVIVIVTAAATATAIVDVVIVVFVAAVDEVVLVSSDPLLPCNCSADSIANSVIMEDYFVNVVVARICH